MDYNKLIEVLNEKLNEGLVKLNSLEFGTEEFGLCMQQITNSIYFIRDLKSGLGQNHVMENMEETFNKFIGEDFE